MSNHWTEAKESFRAAIEHIEADLADKHPQHPSRQSLFQALTSARLGLFSLGDGSGAAPAPYFPEVVRIAMHLPRNDAEAKGMKQPAPGTSTPAA